MSERKWAFVSSVDWFHFSVGVKVNIPRHTKHNFQRWAVKIRLAFFALELQRLNEHRVSKIPQTVEEIP